jgi:hypothetical protein
MRRSLSIAAFVAAASTVLAPAATAFPLDGCTMSVQSMRADGTVLDEASGPGPDGTQDEPLDVASTGSVKWSGTTGSHVIKNNSWHIEVFYLPTLYRGSEANADGDTGAEGTVDFGKDAPFRFTGLYFVAGGMSGDGGACGGSGWVKVIGDPIGTVPFFAGLAFAIIGLLLLGWSVVRDSILSGVVGGLIAGLGVATLLVIFSSLPLGAATPLAVLAIGIVVGLACGLVGRSAATRRLA